jgi:hypothetical protein
MDVTKALHKIIENGMRRFEKWLTRPQMKAVRSVFRGIIRKTTTILSALNEDEIDSGNYREKISYHLGNIDLVDEVEAKWYACAKETKNVKWYMIGSYDESDIFKPNAKKMQWLKWVRDGSSGLRGQWYVIRGINVNGVSVYSRLEEVDESKISKSEYAIEAIDYVDSNMRGYKMLYVIDRWWDCIELVDDLNYWGKRYVIRGKTNRVLIDSENGKRLKVTSYPIGRTKVLMEWWTELYVWRIDRKWYREAIILYTNVEELDWKDCLDLYLKRWKIEEDFNKMKDLWLEDVRLFSMKKIKNILAIIQFIIILWQDVYNEVMGREWLTEQWIYLYFKKFCKWRSTTENPQSFIRFISHHIKDYKPYVVTNNLDLWLFAWVISLKKLRPI